MQATPTCEKFESHGERVFLDTTKDGLTGSASRSQSWDFDALGNFDSQTTDGTAQTRGHNKQNEITSISGATTPTYDANGNLTRDETGRTFKFDAWNHLAEVRDSGNNLLATYRYDTLGRRVRETRGATTTDLYYSDQWQVLEERVGGVVKLSYVWSPVYVDALIARDRDTNGDGTLDERLYAVQDANFNVVALFDTSGIVVERYAYDPYGTPTVYDAGWVVRPGGSNYGWNAQHQGLRWDPVTGKYHGRNRDYDPVEGRWMQLDLPEYLLSEMNSYRYETNASVSRIDPQGLDSIDTSVRISNSIKGDDDGVLLGTAGAFFWPVKFDLSKPADPKGGVIIQDLTVSWKVWAGENAFRAQGPADFDSDSNDLYKRAIPAFGTRARHYLEAWIVAPNSTIPKERKKLTLPPIFVKEWTTWGVNVPATVEFDDTFAFTPWLLSLADFKALKPGTNKLPVSQGNLTMKGIVTYYDGVAEACLTGLLGFKPDQTKTGAGGLLALWGEDDIGRAIRVLDASAMYGSIGKSKPIEHSIKVNYQYGLLTKADKTYWTSKTP
jgi:RHS repeat-associated protein